MSYAVGVFCWYYANSGPVNSNLVTQIFQYLAEILEPRIKLRSDTIDKLVGYIDLDWGKLKDKHKSTNRYTFLFSKVFVSH